MSEKISETSKEIKAPIAKKLSHLMTHHNHQRDDSYYWMRDDERQDKEILAHLKAENDYCDHILAGQKPLEDKIFEELKGRIVKDDSTVPVRDGDFWYHSTLSGDDEFACHYRTTSFEGANKLLLLDVNQLASDYEFYELGDISISQNDELLAYSEDIDGRRIYTIRFKDINSGEYLSDVLENTEGQTAKRPKDQKTNKRKDQRHKDQSPKYQNTKIPKAESPKDEKTKGRKTKG